MRRPSRFCRCALDPENAPCEWCERRAELAETSRGGDVERNEMAYEAWLERIAGE